MTNRYVRSTDGSNADTGLTWPLAKATLSNAASGAVANDTIYVSQLHAETTAGSIFFIFAGIASAPVKVICGNDGAEPPTTAAVTGVCTVTGVDSQIQISGSVYCYGLAFIANSTGLGHIWLHNSADRCQLWDTCSFQVNSPTTANLYINATATSSGNVKWRNCTIKFGATTSAIFPEADNWVWEGGSALSGTTSPTGLISLSPTRTTNISISGVDFSFLDPNFYFIGVTGGGLVTIRNCKLPALWSGGLYNGLMDFANRVEMYDCASDTANYNLLVQDFTGTITQETTIKRSNGASDGFTSYSIYMLSNVNCNRYYGEFRSIPISMWNDVVGVPVTLTIDICHDNITALNNDEAYLQVEYLSSTGSPISTFTNDGLATPLSVATAQTTSTNTWTTTGLASPNIQALSVTVTPQMRGYLHCRVVLTRASYPIYVDTKLQVS